MKPTLVIISGPTAVGKTAFAIELAKAFNTEILSADSRQFFKELNIGTATPTEEELSQVKHHFINNKSILDEYNASQFEKEVLDFLSNYFEKNNLAILVGGSGLYINAITNGFDMDIPQANHLLRKQLDELYQQKGLGALQEKLNELDSLAKDQIDFKNPKRLIRAIEICSITGQALEKTRKGHKKDRFFEVLEIGLELPREILYQRINKRVESMMKQGLLDEVKAVEDLRDKNALKTVGYKELFDYLDGKVDLDFAVEKIKVNSRRYAKRQMTWFKKNDSIRWFSPTELLEVITYIRSNEPS